MPAMHGCPWAIAGKVTRSSIRPLLVLLHRYVGLTIAGFLIVAGLTGAVIAFEKEVDGWLNPAMMRVEPDRRSLPLNELVARIERARPDLAVATIELPEAAGRSVRTFVTAADGTPAPVNELFADPATGAVLGTRLWGDLRLDRQHIVPLLYAIHQDLHLPGEWGRWLMGGVALAWVFDCFVGFALTLPRGHPFLRKWAPSWRIKRGAGSWRTMFDWHRASGLWLWPALLVVAVTSVSLNLYKEVFSPLLTRVLPVEWPMPGKQRLAAAWTGYDAAVACAHREARRIGRDASVRQIVRINAKGMYRVKLRQPDTVGGGPLIVHIAGDGCCVIATAGAGTGASGDKVIDLMFPLHSGEAGGLGGRILICLTGLIVAGLSITGIWIWLRKRAGRLRRIRTGSVRLARA